MKKPFKEDLDNIMQRIVTLLDELNGKRILITGGTGFLGKWLLESIVYANRKYDLGVQLTVLSRSPEKFLTECPYLREFKELAFIQGDVRRFKVNSKKFDYVLHAATEASAKLEQEDPEEMYSVITDGTRHMLEFAQHCSATRFLFISSGAIYGPQPTTLSFIPETYCGNPVTAYGKGKKISEQLCLDVSIGHFDCVIARPFAFVGPHLPLNTHFAIGNFIQDCMENRPIIIKGDGTPLRSYMYAADLAVWIWTILLKGQNGRAYNVGSDCPISIAKLAEELIRVFKRQKEIKILQTPDMTSLSPRYVPDVSRAMGELKLGMNYDLGQSLENTIRWHLMQRAN